MEAYYKLMMDIVDKAFKLYAAFVMYIRATPPLTLAVYGLIIVSLGYVLRMIIILFITKLLTRREVILTRPYLGGKKILIVGDSTAVGTGARRKEETIAGRFAQDFPHSHIQNLAANGSLTRDVLKQFKKAGDAAFDLIIISTGGNDIWNFTNLRSLSRDFTEVLKVANAMSNNRVIVLFFGNEGSAPFFPFFVRGLLLRRTERVKGVFAEVVSGEKVPFVELFTSYEDNPFTKDPKRFFARDALHPSGEGYRLWYERMWRIMVENGYLYDERPLVHTSKFSGDIHK